MAWNRMDKMEMENSKKINFNQDFYRNLFAFTNGVTFTYEINCLIKMFIIIWYENVTINHRPLK